MKTGKATQTGLRITNPTENPMKYLARCKQCGALFGNHELKREVCRFCRRQPDVEFEEQLFDSEP